MLGYESNLEEILIKTIRELKSICNKENNITFNQRLELEIETLQWVLDIKRIVGNDIHDLKRIIQDRINKLNIELEKQDRFDIYLISYGIEILKPCLFLLNLDLEKKEIEKRLG
jgi:hypothetical protein